MCFIEISRIRKRSRCGGLCHKSTLEASGERPTTTRAVPLVAFFRAKAASYSLAQHSSVDDSGRLLSCAVGGRPELIAQPATGPRYTELQYVYVMHGTSPVHPRLPHVKSHASAVAHSHMHGLSSDRTMAMTCGHGHWFCAHQDAYGRSPHALAHGRFAGTDTLQCYRRKPMSIAVARPRNQVSLGSPLDGRISVMEDDF